MLGVKLKGSADRLNVKQERRRRKEDSKALGRKLQGWSWLSLRGGGLQEEQWWGGREGIVSS